MKITLSLFLIITLAVVVGCRRRATEQADTQAEMVLIRGGTFLMGTDHGLAVEGPAHPVRLKPFLIDRYPVTVAQFADFVAATGYRTTAERLGWSGVFDLRAGMWQRVNGADWRHPDGPASAARLDEPATQVSWDDAAAYAAWAHKRLPTEAEFECAARGGLQAKAYAWGDDWRPGGKYMANCWQGDFPAINTAEDGFSGRAPVGSYTANGYGLYDMTGNVWEWCADWFEAGYYQKRPCDNPAGPVSGQFRVIRGGSWLCSFNYCQGFRVAARNHASPDTGVNNLGFRCAADAALPAQ
ncbi:MAG TPA: formylglycine-generating enzyme family protein [Blastocatellia bacterium]|nr:formylglycine-generating enzyme family protein [Blastocatellia bacterium]